MIFIGVDPGADGGIAIIETDGGNYLYRLKGITEAHMFQALDQYDLRDRLFAVLENPGSKPGAYGTARLRESTGFLRGLLVACVIPFDFVAPGKWQREFGLIRTNKNETDTAKKNRHKQAAERLYPTVKVYHWNADALLLAEYAKRTWMARNTKGGD